MQYSPVCETNAAAYIAYLFATVVCNGECTGQPVCESGRGCCDSCGRCRVGDGSSVVDVFRRLCLADARGNGRMVCFDPGHCGSDNVCGYLDVSDGRDEDADVGMAGGHVGADGSDVVPPVCVGQFGNVEQTQRTGETAGVDRSESSRGLQSGICRLVGSGVDRPEVGGKVSEGVGTESADRGKNWARNQQWKQEKKRKKMARRSRKLSAALSKDWNADKLVSKHVGYFADCPPEVQAQLKQTRAELMIARNQRDTVAAKAKLRELQSDVQLVSETLKVLKLQADFEAARKKVNDVRVGGWAQTVLTGASVSMIEEARSRGSSVPSLESVNAKDSVSQSGTSAPMTSVEHELRLTQYKLAVAEAEKRYSESPYYIRSDFDAELNAIKAEFADVAYTGEERLLREAGNRLLVELGTRANNDLMECMMKVGLLDLEELPY